jgi:hypothetical protein
MDDTPNDTGNVVELHDRDQRMLDLRVGGVGVRAIARQFKINIKMVLEVLDRLLPTVTVEDRMRILRTDLERLDQLEAVWFKTAKEESDAQATSLVLRIQERRSSLLGLDAPAKIDIAQVSQAERGTTTDQIEAALNRIRSSRPLQLVDGTSTPTDPPPTEPPAA